MHAKYDKSDLDSSWKIDLSLFFPTYMKQEVNLTFMYKRQGSASEQTFVLPVSGG